MKNKKGFVITVGGIVLTLLIFIIVVVLMGGAAAFSLGKIPTPIWIIIGIILLFKIIGGKK